MQLNKKIYEVKSTGGKNCLRQFVTGQLLAQQQYCLKGLMEKSKSESRTEHKGFTVKTTNTVLVYSNGNINNNN